jgi:hypothetical protein
MNYSKKYEIAVVGGGVAGVAAALSAARQGKRTVLIEKTALLGGLATTGLIYVYLPLCDGNGTQVSFGICEELIQLSLKYGPGDIPANWNMQKNAAEVNRYRCVFSPAAFILALDEVLEEAGVEIWLDTLVCGTELDSDCRVTGVQVENKSGRGLIEAECFIDASGDGEVARRAGASFEPGHNYLSMWALQYNEKSAKNALAENIEMFIDGCPPYGRPGMNPYGGLKGREVSEFVLAGRKLLREYYRKEYASGNADRKSLYPLTLPAMPQFRKIAAVKGLKTLSGNQQATYFEDSIGLVADWRRPGSVWEIPYGSLIPEKVKGLLTAGRCISSVGDAWEVTRVIPAAVLTGEAAGIAAAISVNCGVSPGQLEVEIIQARLRKTTIPVHLQDVGLPKKKLNKDEIN